MEDFYKILATTKEETMTVFSSLHQVTIGYDDVFKHFERH